MDVAAAIAMSVGAYRTQLLFDKMKDQAPAPTAGEKTGVTHPPGAT